jgi:polar amino acid transport system substrate-binding protein
MLGDRVSAATARVATASNTALAQRDLGDIVKRGILRIAMPEFDAPPFFLEFDNQLVGTDVSLAQSIANELGVATQFVRQGNTFNAAVTAVVNGSADIAICKLSRTLQRALVVSFSEPYLVLRHALGFNRVKLAEIARGQDLTYVVRNFTGRIGVIARSSYVEYARSNFPRAAIVEVADWATVQKMLRNGDIAAAYRDEFEIKRLVKLDPGFSVVVRTVTLKDTYDSIGIAMAPNTPDLKSFVNLLLAQRAEMLSVDLLLERYSHWLR